MVIKMLCERCKKRNATIHMTEIVNNVNREIHLCEQCAREVGLNTGSSGFSLTVPEMLTFLDIKDVSGNEEARVCQTCSLKYTDFKRSGKFGCSDCYVYFPQVHPVLEKKMSGMPYPGKIPENYSAGSDVHEEFVMEDEPAFFTIEAEDAESLNVLLQQAIDEERYEDAAMYRDRLRKIDNEKITRG